MIDAAEVLLDATLQREVLETPQVLSHSQSQDRRETASLLRYTSIVHQNAARGGLVDAEHAQTLEWHCPCPRSP